MTATGWHARQQRTGSLPEAMVAQVHRGEPDRAQVPCPRGATVVRAPAFVCRTVETLGGPVQVERPSFYGRGCREGTYLLDEVVGVRPGRMPWDVQQAAGDLAPEVPSETASPLCGRLTGMPVSRERRHTFTPQVAEDLSVVEVTPAREEIAPRVGQVAAGRLRRPVLVLGMEEA